MAEMRLIDSNDAVCSYVETWTCNSSDYGTQKVMAVDDISTLPEIDPETLPIVQELRAELEKAKKERDAAVNDLRGCAVEDYAECMYCSHRNKGTFCCNCMNGSNWEWRGLKDENNS